MDWTNFLTGFSSAFGTALSWVGQTFGGIIKWAADHLKSVWSVLKGALSKAIGVLRTLTHLKWSELWHLLKQAYAHLRQWIRWYQNNVLKPLSDLRASVMRLYNTYFRPIIAVLESLRTMVRFLSIFDRKLAALLDSKLSALESLVMSPITAALKRINGLSSYLRAIITPLGMLDRVLLLESMRRDASLIWEVLTNPRAAIHTITPAPQPYLYSDLKSDVHLWATNNTGPVADYVQQAQAAGREVSQGVT